jgi:hypothetical protein
MSDDVMLEAGAAAEQVGVSASGLRRLAPLYEAVHGELPRKPKSLNRLWPLLAVERLQAARRLVEAERYRTISDALTALARGLEPDDLELAPPAASVSPDATQQALEVLTAEVRELRRELAEIRALPPAGFREEPDDLQRHGPLVRVAMALERWLKR